MVDFVVPLSQKDTTACQSLITDLKSQLPNDTTSWEQPLTSLLNGIELYYHHEILLAILKSLPNTITEALFLKLTNSSNFNYSCLKTLIAHINSISWNAKAHQAALINILLSSPIIFLNQPDIEKLLLLLTKKEQETLLTQVRYQVEQNTTNANDKKFYPNRNKLNQIYSSNYQQLLTFLTLQLSQNELSLQTTLDENPRLANMLMSQLLNIEESTVRQKELTYTVLKEHKHYDWTDLHFSKMVQVKLITAFTIASVQEIKELFCLYLPVLQKNSFSVNESIQFLDDLYSTTKNINIIANCLEEVDDDKHQMAFDFLVHSKIKERSLRQLCLKKINITQLELFHKHMMASGQMGNFPNEEITTDFFCLFCNHLNKLLNPRDLLKKLADMVRMSPENTANLAISTTIKHLSSPELISLWLQALIEVSRSKTQLIPHCIQFIKNHPDNIHLIIPMVNKLSDEDLLCLYLSMIAEELDRNYFLCFKELFKNPMKHVQLFYLLKSTPNIPIELLTEFIAQLDDKALIYLIDELLTHSNQYHENKTTINQVLLIFCQRLYSEPNPTAPINQWQRQAFTHKLADALLDSPECVYHLTTNYSTIYSLVTWTSSAEAIKHRMDAVLNCYEIESDRIKQIAQNWMAYFYSYPEQFSSIFNTLRATKNNRTPIGSRNFTILIQECWEIMKLGLEFNEEAFFGLLHTPRPDLHKTALIQVTQIEYFQQYPYRGSLWLAKLKTFPQNMNSETLITLLTQSTLPTNMINWTKAAIWVKSLSNDEQLNFIKKLLEIVCFSNNNPILTQKTHQFIIQHPLFDSFLPTLNPLDWYWLLKNASKTQIIEQTSHWLDVLIEKHGVHKLNLGKIFSLLPQNITLVETILKKKSLSQPNVLGQITSQLAVEYQGDIHFRSIQRCIIEHDKTWRKQYLHTTISQLKTPHLNSAVLHIFHILILDKDTAISTKNSLDRTLVINYIKLLNILISKTEKGKNSAELNELMIKILGTLVQQDPFWSQLIGNEEAFTQTILRWLATIDLKTISIDHHPLIRLFLNCQTTLLDYQLISNSIFQRLLQLILSSPHKDLTSDQFTILFNWLLPENKTLLSQHLLSKSQLSEVQINSLTILANSIAPVELFELMDSHENPKLISKGLLTHQEGFKDLSLIQRAQVVNHISSSAELISILNSSIPIVTRINFIKELFLIYGQSAKTLSKKLGQWLINPETIAALANLTIDESHQRLLDEVLLEKTYYRDYLNEYLQNPTLDMPLNQNSYLGQLARKTILNPDIKKLYQAQFIENLTPEDIFKTVKLQFYLARDIEVLSNILKPFNSQTQNACRVLQTAQWQHQLSLIHSGLLEVVRVYKDKQIPETTKQTIEQTNLYNEFLLPFMIFPIKDELGKKLPIKLISLLQSYIQKMSPLDKDHCQLLQNTLNRYASQLHVIKSFSLPRLVALFTTDPQTISTNQEDIGLLKNAHILHTDWLKRFNLEPDKNFTEILTVGLKSAALVPDEQMNQWFFQSALFSSLSAPLDEACLKNYLNSIKPTDLSSLINSFIEQEQICRKTQKLLQNIKPKAPVTEFIKQLLNLESISLKQIIIASESLNLLALKDLICLAAQIKELRLSEEQISALCLSATFNDPHQIDWIHLELQQMDQQIDHASHRLEQLIRIGFGFVPDTYNVERLLHLADKKLAHISTETLIYCLNSYKEVFANQDDNTYSYLMALDKFLDNSEKAKEILINIEVQLVKLIIDATVKKPMLYSGLLEKLINSNHEELCLHELQMELKKRIKQSDDPQPTDITELSAKQIESYSPAELSDILSLQRLLFFGKPSADLIPFATCPELHETLKDRRLFCADASLYMALVSIEKKSNTPIKKSASWLAQHGLLSIKTYVETMQNITSEKERLYPLFLYSWLCWGSFIVESVNHDLNPLVDGFLYWLSTTNEYQLKDSSDLFKLLQHVADQQALLKVFKKVSEHHQKLTTSQINWLCENSLQITPQDKTLFPLIINLNSWSWLENYMKESAPQNFELLKAALENSAYIKSINEHEATFLNTLEMNQFTPHQILELISLVHNERVKSFLIIHLLSQQDYLMSLKGESVLNRLSNNDNHAPSRLNALVRQIDISTLTEAKIGKLPPEVAVSIICSIPHFHLLQEEQIALLLKRYPHPEVITYWMNHYSSMPNAYYIIAHLMKFADTHVITALNKIEETKREVIIHKLIEHLDSFHPTPQILMENNEEPRLTLAIRLFLNGHQHPTYVGYINKLTDKLLNNNHEFSLQTIQLLLSLCNKQEFSKLTNKTAILTNQYLRASALSGEIGLFYDSGRLNVDSMNQQVQLKPINIPEPEKPTGFFSSLFSSKAGETKKLDIDKRIPEHSLIEDLGNYRNRITSLSYFLIHFRGDKSKVSKLINDYLDYHTTERCTGSRRKMIYQITDLMIRSGLNSSIREELFISFLRHPELYDKQISFALFVFDAKRAIQYFGLKGGEKNYTQVINLCTWALQKLDPKKHQDVISIANNAKEEAELELSYNQEKRFFTRLFIWVKRFWHYGWTGFFKPNPPTYVAPSSSEIIATHEELQINDTSIISLLSYKPEPNLVNLLKEVAWPMPQKTLDELAEAINSFSLKAKMRSELETRQKVHELFLKLQEHSKEDKMVGTWLTQNQVLLTTNLFRLLELTLVKAPQTALESLLNQIKDVAPSLQQVSEEFICTLPEQQEEKVSVVSVQQEPELNHLTTLEVTLESTIETSTGIAYQAYDWVKSGLSSLFKEHNPSLTNEIQERSDTTLALH